MYFENFASLVHMDGHGLFVWSAYSISLLVVLWNLFSPLFGHKSVLKAIKRQNRINNARNTRYKAQGERP